jgi:hypothetical protein
MRKNEKSPHSIGVWALSKKALGGAGQKTCLISDVDCQAPRQLNNQPTISTLHSCWPTTPVVSQVKEAQYA